MSQKKADNTTPTIQAAILAAYSLNVGNLRDTGHSAEATPPAAMADFQPAETSLTSVASSATAEVANSKKLTFNDIRKQLEISPTVCTGLSAGVNDLERMQLGLALTEGLFE